MTALVLAITLVVSVLCPGSAGAAPSSSTTPTFVGAEVCGRCHQEELKLWRKSHHELAMQPASDSTVLGNFANVTVTNAGTTSRFFRAAGNFFVRTEGPDSVVHDYRIKFTFGVFPLQQYLIELPGGRLQAFGIAWDSRSREAGGQRWFSLYPDQKISPGDPLHWTGIDQNWNHMCADCHSTNVRKNYHLSNRTFATTYSEINVACEACHGPGSNHLAWARKESAGARMASTKGLTIDFSENRPVQWKIDPSSGNARRNEPLKSEREIDTCARCHSRRSLIHEDYVHGQPLEDDYRVALLEDELYFADGQIKGEDYEYGSFIQSRMFHAGVTCSDCHDPHSLRLRVDGNGVCLRCHAGRKYDSVKHHFHKTASPGAQCVNCHMPARTYMMVDPRRDHSIRIPRPDLSTTLATPNACNKCHKDKPARWAADEVAKWYGHQLGGYQRFAETLEAGKEGAPGARARLRALALDGDQPAIARATAIAMLSNDDSASIDSSVLAAVADASPLIRRAAAETPMDNLDPRAGDVKSRFLQDPVRSVRIAAAGHMSGLAVGALSDPVAKETEKSLEEYIDAQQLNADRPEAHVNLALVSEQQQKYVDAEMQLRTALNLDPSFVPASVDLADLYRALGREADAEKALRTALRSSPDNAVLSYALALSLIRQNQRSKGLDLLATAARNEPTNSRYSYVYAIALDEAGRTSDAVGVLKESVQTHPYDDDSLKALVSFLQKEGKTSEAKGFSQRLRDLEAEDRP